MAEELRLAFILLGSLAIGAVILHGVWTVRKAVGEERKRNTVKPDTPESEAPQIDLESQALKLQQMEMDFNELQSKSGDSGGLPVANMDVDSIYHKGESAPKPESTADTTADLAADKTSESNDSLVAPQGETEPTFDFEPQNELFQQQSAAPIAPTTDDLKMKTPVEEEDDLGPKLGNWSFVSSEEEETNTGLESAQNIEIADDVSVGENPSEQSEKAKEGPQEVLMLFVDKAEGQAIEGARLLPLLLTLGFKFGEMEFFHRHEASSGQGEILFSLANMFNPGTFDPDNMEQFSTRGLTIFMTLPNALEPLQTFNMMHNAAKKIADEFDAVVLNDKRQPLDVSIVRSYVERIRKFNH